MARPPRPPRRPGGPLRAALALSLAVLAFAAGCRDKDETSFFHGTNFAAKEEIISLLNDFRDGVNARDADRVLAAWPADFRFPDERDPTLVHSAETLREGWRDFFARADLISYAYDDLFLRVDESNAYADARVRRTYRGHAPFVHTVDDSAYERLYFKTDGAGRWRLSTAPHRLRPPQILDR